MAKGSGKLTERDRYWLGGVGASPSTGVVRERQWWADRSVYWKGPAAPEWNVTFGAGGFCEKPNPY